MTDLVKNVTDLKKHIAIDFINGFDVVEFAVEDRELELKDKYIGDALWANLVKEYAETYSNAASSTEALYTKALWYAQRVISNYSLLDYIPEGSLDISENGIRISTTDSKKQAFDWQIKKLEQKYLSTAVRNLEALLTMLNENIDVFTDWTSSAAYVANKKNFVNSATQFSQYLNIGKSHLLFLELVPVVSYVEDFYLRSILGDAFFEELQERVKDGEDVDDSTSGSTSGEVLADHYDKVFHLVKGAVVHYTGMEAAETVEHKFDKEKCGKKADHYVQRLVEYLNHNASDTLFAKYFTSTKYTAPVDSVSYTSGGGIDNSELTGVFGAF